MLFMAGKQMDGNTTGIQGKIGQTDVLGITINFILNTIRIQPVLWIRIQIVFVFSNFVDPYSEYGSGSTQVKKGYI